MSDRRSDDTKEADVRPGLSLRFSARDLMNTAIFAVLLIVVIYASGMLGVISPLVWLVMVPVQAIAGGVVMMLFLARVRHAGMVLLFAAVVLASFVGGLLGSSMLSKHFVRAGLA